MLHIPTNDSNQPRPQLLRSEGEALRLLASATQLLESSMDYEATLDKVAQLLVSSLATWCSIDLVSNEGKIERVSGAHRDPAREHLIKEILHNYPASPKATRGVYRVIQTGQSIMIPVISEKEWAVRADNNNHLQMIMELGSTSYMCVPLIVRGRIIGSIMLLSEQRTYGELDLATAEEVARCIAMAVDNVRMFRKMQDAVRVRDEFLAILSHELRTPLNVIQGWVEILKNETLDKAGFQQAIDILDRNSKIQAAMINDLLDISRFISGKFSIEKISVDLGEVVKKAMESVRLQAERKKIVFEQHIEAGPHMILGDTCHLHRMFTNLLINAVKFTPQGGNVSATFRTADGFAEIRVQDNGKGIDSHFIPHVFEVFRQEDSASNRVHEGLGLGLAIAKHIVEQHGGDISVKSNGRDKGTEFIVRLPRTKTIVDQKHDVKNDHPSDQPLQGVSVLVVDDAADMRFLITRYLKKSGAEVVAVESASRAFREIQKMRPDVLLSDIAMPEEDGYSLIQRIRKLPDELGGSTRAIALTAYAREEEKQKTLAAGFDAHLAKPIFGPPLIETICELRNLKH